MIKPSRLALSAWGLALAVIVVDQITKAWMLYGLAIREVGRIEVLPPLFNLTFVLNRGVSFGLLTGGEWGRWALTVFSLAVAGLLGWWALSAQRRLLAVAIGLIMGGAIGNVIDRVRFGGVVDFLDFSGAFFPWIFNVADSAISIGVVVLVIDSLLAERRDAVGTAAEKS